jgi:FKBP12-rapamycin complex-associated protein
MASAMGLQPPPAAAAIGGGGAADPLSGLSRCLAGLCRPGAAALREEHALASFVDSEGRSVKGDKFNRFLAELHARVKSLVLSPDPHERLAGVLAIDELAHTKVFCQSAARLSDLMRVLMEAFQATTEVQTMHAAAATLGRLVKAGGPLMADIVEEQVKRGIQWLAAPRQEHLRLAGVLLLRELAEAAPAIFNVHVRSFIEVIWNPLRDSRQHVREAAVKALRACLVLVEKRETRYRVQWYYRLFEETQRGLTRVTSLETVHGSLLALGELLRHTGEFMLARYREVCDTVLRFRDSKEKLVRRAVITLIPRLAAFAPERFVKSYLKQACEYLLSVLSVPAERGAGFIAIAEMAAALARAGVAYRMKAPDDFLRPIAAAIKECLGQRGRGKPPCPESLECAGALAVALRQDWQPYLAALLEPMFQTGLSEALVASMHKAVGALPDLLPRVQALLLDLLSLALARRPFSPATPAATVAALQGALAAGELQGPALTRLTLHTLGSFSWTPHLLLDFVRDHVAPYLDDNDSGIRRSAAVAACHVLEQHVQYSRRPGGRLPAAEQRAVDKTVQRLLASAVADPSVTMRRTILEALSRTTALEHHLAQAECLRSLFVALNDESSTVRSLTIQLAGHISATNPAYVMPALRRHLMQLLSDMDHSPDSRQREESARLLGVLIRSAPKLVLPYTAPVLRALVGKLRAAGSSAAAANAATAQPNKASSHEEGFEVAVLMTLGELATVAGSQLRADVPEILPLVIDAIQDGSSPTKRLVAVGTLGQVVGSTGCVVSPYLEYPQLLGVLLRMLSEGTPSTRREVMKVVSCAVVPRSVASIQWHACCGGLCGRCTGLFVCHVVVQTSLHSAAALHLTSLLLFSPALYLL